MACKELGLCGALARGVCCNRNWNDFSFANYSPLYHRLDG